MHQFPSRALLSLLIAVTVLAFGAGTGAQPSLQEEPSPTTVPRPVSDVTLDQLTMLYPGEESIQLRGGESRDLELGVIECCYFFIPAPVEAVWSVVPAEGATIDAGTGMLTIDPMTPSGSVFTVRADVEHGRRVVTAAVYVYTPEANPLVGSWSEVAQVACGTGTENAPEQAIEDLVFRADGTFDVTWQPFELYRDYGGTYRFDLARGTVELIVDWGNYVPDDVDGSGGFATDGTGTLWLTDLWLGSPQSSTNPPACGHRFVRPGSTAAERSTPTPLATSTPTLLATSTPIASVDGACYVVRDRPPFPALVGQDGAIAGECGDPMDPDVRVFLAVEATWMEAGRPIQALVTNVDLEAGGRADFGLVINVEGGPRAVPLRAGERWSVAECETVPSAPATPAATPAATARCVASDQALTGTAEGVRIDPVTGTLTIDPATSVGRRFAVSAVFVVEGVHHERTIEVLIVPGAGTAA